MRHLAAILVVASATTVSAQPAAILGKPLPSADLPTGTISVRVVDGTITVPLVGTAVWLSVDGAPRSATTDAMGRAVFAGLRVGASVTAAIAVPGKPSVMSDKFVVPASGGVRVMLSPKPLQAGPKPREFSGRSLPIDGSAPGSLDLRLTYNNLDDPNPPVRVRVALVGYRADSTVTVTTAATDARGIAHFTGLDHSGAVAYLPLATLPRNGAADRLAAFPIVLDAESVNVALSADDRAAKTPPVDELVDGRVKPIARNKVHVTLQGATQPDTEVRLIDAATGKQVATGKGEHDVTLDLATHGDPVFYVEAIARNEHYRSQPFQAVADRGVEIAVAIYPRVLLELSMIAEANGASVSTWGRFVLRNNSWIPYALASEVALPKGFSNPTFAEDDRASARFTKIGFQLARPIPPGEIAVRARFDLAAGTDGKVNWSLDLPFGMFQSSFRIAKDPGVALIAPAAHVETATFEGEDYLTIPSITILPKQSMAMTIELPKLTPGQVAVARACQPLMPDRKTALRGKPMPELTAPQLDGKALRLASLKGKVIVVNFMATWDMLSGTERPTFAPLAKALGTELAIVLVASDADRAEVAAKVGANPPFRVVLDPPANHQPDDNIGPITRSWGVHLLPESFVIDKHGIVRAYFANSRDWSTPAALACLKAIARD